MGQAVLSVFMILPFPVVADSLPVPRMTETIAGTVPESSLSLHLRRRGLWQWVEVKCKEFRREGAKGCS